MRLVLLSHDYAPDMKGGVGRITQVKAESLVRRGHSVDVVTRGPGPRDECRTLNGVRVHRVAVNAVQLPAAARSLGLSSQIWDESAAMANHVNKIDETAHVDFVDAPIWRSVGIATLLSRRHRVVTSLQTTESLLSRLGFAAPHPNDPGAYSAERTLLLESELVIANSSAIKVELESLYGLQLESDRCAVIHHGIPDVAATDAPSVEPETTTRVLVVGRLEARKGTDLLWRVASRVRALDDTIVFDVVGADPHGLASSAPTGVRIYGHVTDDTLSRLYERASLVLFPSRYESFGLTIIEAMMHSKAVVAFRTDAIREVLGDAGQLAEPESVTELADAVVALAHNPSLRRMLGARGRRRFAHGFSAHKMTTTYEDFLRSRS